MKTKQEVHDLIDQWWEDTIVGNLILYRAPGANVVECILEEVIKIREMEAHVSVAFECLMDGLGAERGEIFRDKNGKPDRVKITRRYECTIAK
jgi:hypothetical protein